ncbi:LamG-like jellyroll fold domain-containing protein [Verrucomicrobiota bacterium sgz303538]
MNLSDKDTLELHELCNALADGTITEAQQRRLSDWLRESEEARQFYVRSMALSASLFQYAGEMMAEAPDARSPRRRRIIRPGAWWVAIPIAAAAVFMLAFWLGGNRWTNSGAGSSSESESDEMVARLSGSDNCRWGGASIALGDELRSGQRLDLVAGAAEITFDSGAQVVLEAPASIEVTSAWNAVLSRGTLKATVPAQAVGFRVTNAAVDVVDLGTEFSMVADENGGTEVFVLKGAVETTSQDTFQANRKRLVLRERQARRFARSGVSDVTDREAKLTRLGRRLMLERIKTPFGYAHWDFDAVKDDVLTAQTTGLPGGKYEMKVKHGAALATLQTAGRWGSALDLDGSTALEAPFPKLSARSSRTVAFWTRIAPDPELSGAGPAVAWRFAGKEARLFQVGWNRNPALGAFGVLDARLGKRSVVGMTPLRDGQWHHVAVVLTPNRKNETGMQIRKYTDGRLEGTAARAAGKRRGNIARRTIETPDIATDVLAIGGITASAEHFRGSVDELYVCDRALAPWEIAHLMQENQILMPESRPVD